MYQFFLIAVGGFFGSMLRFFISQLVNKHFFGTWIANITGSLLLAVLLKFYLQAMISEAVWLCLGVGFCGAYTTFSTFGKETIQLVIENRFHTAFYYVLCSFLTSIGIVALVITW